MKKLILMLFIAIPALTACLDDGDTGKPGSAGQQGVQGTQGIEGVAGATGSAGADGHDGVDGQDAQTCLMGVYLPGAYLMRYTREDAMLHSSWLIVDTGREGDRGHFSIKALNTTTGVVSTLVRESDGVLSFPWIGSCLGIPPIPTA